MRATILGVCATCLVLTIPVHAAAPIPSDADEAALTQQIEALQDRSADRWQGRRHYLYDEQYQPGIDTVGTVPSDVRACSRQPVRLKRSDGSTVVKHFGRCD